jgi:hypothetical protein
MVASRPIVLPLLAASLLVAAACSSTSPDRGQLPNGDVSPAPGTSTPAPRGEQFSRVDWPRTDFARSTVPLGEILPGCPVRDCIPALDAKGAVTVPSPRGGHAQFAPVQETELASSLPVAYIVVEGHARAYPLHILTWHEIVNDVIEETPVLATFCPLCNTALAFDRRVGGQVLDFGVSGNLRHSDLIMWDRQTESWWQQATGEGIVGEMAGKKLTPISMAIVSFAEFANAYPAGDVLTEDTGFQRDYGYNPYGGYDTSPRPFLFEGQIDARLSALERVVGVRIGSEAIAIPFEHLAQSPVAQVSVAGEPVVVFWAPGTVSALDADEIGASRDVGSAIAFFARVGDRPLSFVPIGPGRFRDTETGSVWSLTGAALEGPYNGTNLEMVEHTALFWFAWSAFFPETSIWTP